MKTALSLFIMLISLVGIHNSYGQTDYTGTHSFTSGVITIDTKTFLESGSSELIIQFTTTDALPIGYEIVDSYNDGSEDKHTSLTYTLGDNRAFTINQGTNAIISEIQDVDVSNNKYSITIDKQAFLDAVGNNFSNADEIQGRLAVNLILRSLNRDKVYIQVPSGWTNNNTPLIEIEGTDGSIVGIPLVSIDVEGESNWYSFDLNTSVTFDDPSAQKNNVRFTKDANDDNKETVWIDITNTSTWYEINNNGTFDTFNENQIGDAASFNYLYLEASNNNYKPTLYVDNKAPVINLISNFPSSDQLSTQFVFEVDEVNLPHITNGSHEYTLEFYTDYRRQEPYFKSISAGSSEINQTGSVSEITFLSNETPETFFGGKNQLYTKLIITDDAGNEATYEGITFVIEPEFFITMDESDKEKVISLNTTLGFSHNLLSDDIDTSQSSATISWSGGGNINVPITYDASNFNLTFETTEIDAITTALGGYSNEKLDVTITINLTTTGISPTKTTTFTHDAVLDIFAPKFVENGVTHEGINGSWIDLTQSTVFKYKVTDYDLDIDATKLMIGGNPVDVSSYVHDESDNSYILSFLLNGGTPLANANGTINVGPLNLKDKAGNQSTASSAVTYSYNEFETAPSGTATYTQNEEVVTTSVDAGTVNVKIALADNGGIAVGDKATVQFYSVKNQPVTQEISITTDANNTSQKVLSFDVTVNNTTFYNNTTFAYDVTITNGSKKKNTTTVFTGPTINLPTDFFVTKTDPDEKYVKDLTVIDFSHNKTNNSSIDQGLSYAKLKNSTIDDRNLNLTFGTGNDNNTFSVTIPNDLSISEGTELTLDIVLYEGNGTGSQAFHSSKLIYDNTAPSLSSNEATHQGIINSDWIDLSQPTIFKFNVNELELDTEETQLTIGSNTLGISSFEKNSSTYTISFILDEETVLTGNNGTINVGPLILKDKAGNEFNAYETPEGYDYNKFGTIPTAEPTYSQTGNANADITVKTGTVNVDVVLSSDDIDVGDIATVQFYGVKTQPEIGSLTITENSSNEKKLNFNINISDALFYNNTPIQYDITITNKSNIKKTTSVITGPIAQFPVNFTVERSDTEQKYVKASSTVTFKHNKTNKDLDQSISKAKIEYVDTDDDTIIREVNLPVFDNQTEDENEFSITIPNDLSNISEGTEITLELTLNETGGTGNRAFHSSKLYYDDTAPTYTSFTHPTFNTTGNGGNRKYWLDLTVPNIFVFSVSDFDLEVDSSFLVIDGDSLSIIDYTEDSRTYTLSYDLGEALTANSGSIIMDSLALMDKSGNTTTETFNNTYYYEKYFELPKLDNEIIYSVIDGNDVDVIGEGGVINNNNTIRVKIPYSTIGKFTNDQVKLFNTIGDEVIISGGNLKTDKSGTPDYFYFDIDIDSDSFYDNRPFAFEISLVNSSLLTFSSGRIEGPIFQFTESASLSISRIDPDQLFVQPGAEVHFKHSLISNDKIDQDESYILLKKNDEDKTVIFDSSNETEEYLVFNEEENTFKISIPTLATEGDNAVAEEEELTLHVYLYKDGETEASTEHTSSIVYDNSVTTTTVSVVKAQGSTIDSKYWLDLTQSSVFTYTVYDAGLDVERSKLLIGTDSVSVISYTEGDSDNSYNLSFNVDEYLPEDGESLTINSLALYDKAGNSLVISDGGVNDTYYYEKDLTINDSGIKYYKMIKNGEIYNDSTEINNNIITEGRIRVKVPYGSKGNINDIEVKVLGAIVDVSATLIGKEINDGAKYITFDVNVDSKTFSHNRLFTFELNFKNYSKLEFSTGRVEGPVFKFPVDFYITKKNEDVRLITEFSEVIFLHNKDDNGDIDTNRATLKIKKGDNSLVTGGSLEFPTGKKEFYLTLNKLLDNNSTELIEGTEVTCEITLYESGSEGQVAFISTTFIYDNQPPKYNGFSKTNSTTLVTEGGETKYWIDLTTPIILEFEVSDHDLDIDKCRLKLSSSEDSIKAIGYEGGKLSFEIDQSFLIGNAGDINIARLSLYDKLGNYIVLEDVFKNLVFNYEKPENIRINKVEVDNVNSTDQVLSAGTKTFKVYYTSVAFKDASVNFLNTKVPISISSSNLNYNRAENYFTFNVNLTEERFFNNSKVDFEVTFNNHSSVTKTIKRSDNLTVQFLVDFYITRENPNEIYLKDGSTIEFNHSSTNKNIDQERSIVTYKIGNSVEEKPLALSFDDANDSKKFSVTIPTLTGVSEGTEVELSITLYQKGASGIQAKQVSTLIYDNDAPEFVEYAVTGINTNIPIDQEETKLPWINRKEQTFFQFTVKDHALDIENCKLKVDIADQIKELELYRFITVDASTTTLMYSLSELDLLAETDTVKIISLELQDKVGNQKAYENFVDESDEKVEYVYEKAFAIQTDAIRYLKAGTEEDIREDLEGPVTIRIPYISKGLSDVVVEFQETKKVLVVEDDSITFDRENGYLEFTIAVSNEFFESDRAIAYSIKMINNSMMEIFNSSIKGPKMKFTTPSEITVDFPDLKQNKWLIEHNDEEQLKVAIKGRGNSVDEEPPLNANKVTVMLDNRVIYEISDNLISVKNYNLYLPARVFPKDPNTGKVILGEKDLYFRLSNDVGSNDGDGRVAILSDVPDIRINKGWLYYHRTGDTFTVKTNLDQNNEVENIRYTPINTPLMSPSDLWKFYGEGTTNDDISVTISAQASDINGASSTDQMVVGITTTDVVTNLQESYCSNNNNENVITITSKYTDQTEDLHLELYRINLGNLEKIDASGFVDLGDFSYQFDPKVIHEDDNKRTERFRVRLVYHDSTGNGNITLGYKEFQTIFEPDVTTDLLMRQPIVGESSSISIGLTDFKDRTYKLLENENIEIVNDIIETSDGQFVVKLKDGFTGETLKLDLQVYSESGRCEIYKSYIVEVSQKQLALSNNNKIQISFSSIDNWTTSFLTQNGDTYVYEEGFEEATPWNNTSNEWKLSGNQKKGHTTLTSPVYDLTFLEKGGQEMRPMLKFIYEDKTTERNGVYLQLRQLENGANENWVTVGKDDEVWNWYNTYGLYNNDLVSNETDYAWSGGVGLLEGRLPLDEYLDDAKTMEKVQFRLVFAYGQNTEDAFKPIQLDIQNRRRNVIVESFLQANNSTHHSILAQLEDMFKKHTATDPEYMHNYYLERSLECEDPLYNRGAEMVEARRLWYGLNSIDDTEGHYALAIDGELFEGNDTQYFDEKISDALRKSVLKDEPVELSWRIDDSNQLVVDYVIADTLIQKVDELLWVFTYGDEQTQIGQCNPLSINANTNNQVIGAVISDNAENEGTVIANLNGVPSALGNNFHLQLLLQHYESMEIFSAVHIPVKRGIVNSVDPSKAVDFTLYPNPAKEVINITYKPTINTSFSIHSVEGQKVKSGSLTGTEIDVRNIPHGMYLLSLYEGGERIAVKTFVKE
ncbi:T9SS type A sorting domain-containing protein [Flammeovirga aprica]|uniref:T9SS type A sorting domain-containing protein n=1 Tax=Flammeovirga aprica JL-4 TaxID=694437 RepID=A0A7X9RZ94_9BACT|nr:T9SS type A sorting domain-containing protein [Flammeovirga aprica]NME71537.1 T9SS type A sorting domain-containing protein [Flammeovirga aprica JL-4]